jgi:hypothetical protein
LLDRFLGASLLRYLVLGDEPAMDKARAEQAADRLYADLCRQGLTRVTFERNGVVDVPGLGPVEAPIAARSGDRYTIIGIHGPLTPDYAWDEALRDAKEFGVAVPVLLVDELVVAQNLPRASKQVIEAVAT